MELFIQILFFLLLLLIGLFLFVPFEMNLDSVKDGTRIQNHISIKWFLFSYTLNRENTSLKGQKKSVPANLKSRQYLKAVTV